jgi:hypothetical protein
MRTVGYKRIRGAYRYSSTYYSNIRCVTVELLWMAGIVLLEHTPSDGETW